MHALPHYSMTHQLIIQLDTSEEISLRKFSHGNFFSSEILKLIDCIFNLKIRELK